MKNLKLIQELAEMNQAFHGIGGVSSYVKAFSQMRGLKKQQKTIIRTYNLNLIASLATQYHQTILARKSRVQTQEYIKIVEDRVRNRQLEAGQAWVNELAQSLTSTMPAVSMNFSEKSMKEMIEDNARKLKENAEEKFSKLTPKQWILLVQSYHARINSISLEYVKLYHASIQNMLEGRREVMQSEDFVFEEDGESVKQKMKHLEDFLKTKMSKFKKNIRIK